MIHDRHHNPALLARLRPLIQCADPTAIIELLPKLSVREFRTAGYLLGEDLLPTLPSATFWLYSKALISFSSKAFLITIMKCFKERLKAGTSSFSDKEFLNLAASLNDIEVQKVSLLLLPDLTTHTDVQQLLDTLNVQQGHERINLLARIDSKPCAFELYRNFRFVEHETDYLLSVARFLIKSGTSQGFNLASLMKVTFGLDALQGTFSLRLEPYQIARIEHSYTAFCQAIDF